MRIIVTQTLLIDVCCTDENTDNMTSAITHSLTSIFPEIIQVQIYGQCTDSDGGGFNNALTEAMHGKNLVGAFYLKSTCLLHSLQTCLRNAVTVLGEGGREGDGNPVMNCMQMLYRAYNLQNWHKKMS